jgi:hypothetical protein
MAEHSKFPKAKKHGKADVRYWEVKLFHDGYTREGKRVVSPDWSVRIQHAGRREAFALGTPNKAAGAAKAKSIFQTLKGAGWEEALLRYKPESVRPRILHVTVGDLLREVERVAGIRPKTMSDYSKALRKIVADVFNIDGGREKFNPHTGGRQKWIEKIDAVRLADLTPEKVQAWKLRFLKRADADPVSQRRARISVNSLLRQAKSLLSKNVMRFLPLKLPEPLPFTGVAFEARQSMRYHSVVDVEKLIGEAQLELAGGDGDKPDQFKVLLLSLCAGLRRNEIDKLEWTAFDFHKHLIRIQETEFFRPKTEESSGDVEIDSEVSSLLEEFRKQSPGRFVVQSDRQLTMNATYSAYRCEKVFDGLIAWLRTKGVNAQKPLHELRKEFGSTIANEHGIFAASRALRHSDIAITTQHYADKKLRTTTGFGKMLRSHPQ